MQVGMLTAPFGSEPIANAVKFASEAGFDALEVITGKGSAHFDAVSATPAEALAVKKLVEDAGLRISQLSFFGSFLSENPDEEAGNQAQVRKVIDTASVMGVQNIGILAGMPLPGKSKMQVTEEKVAPFWGPLCDYAKPKGVRFAMENWFATLLQGLHHFERIFEVLPADNFGLNFDPSHLYHQHIDYLGAVDQFAGRIFHSHAKDTEVNEWKKRWMGTLEGAWWRYVIPGFGGIDWGCYVSALRRNGLADVTLSIEHEDSAFGREEGFVKGLNYLRTFVS